MAITSNGRAAVPPTWVLAARANRSAWHRAALAIIALTIALTALALSFATPRQASAQSVTGWAPPSTVYIPETGQSIDGVFLDYWRSWGGAATFGYPITPELTVNGRIVQYYSYARFEYVPDDLNGAVVHLGKIGAELRPATLPRTAMLDSQATSYAQYLARESIAWLPVDTRAAAQLDPAVRYVPESRHTVSYGFRDFWEASGEAAYLGNPLTEEYIIGDTSYQVFERGKLAWKPGQHVWMMPIGETLAKKYEVDMAPRAQGTLPVYSESLFLPPEFWIDISLSAQYMTVYVGNEVVAGSYVSTGRPGFDTPAGTFYVNTKLESQTMAGVIGGESYNVPDVPWVMYFTGEGHAIHGTYWHNNFGTVMSHGCVNLPMDFAAWLYSVTPTGTRVEIHY